MEAWKFIAHGDELEFGLNLFPWILRGMYPPPAIPPQ